MKFNKIMALLLCFVLVLAAFPASAQTDEIKWVCKKSTRLNSSGELQYPELPEEYEDYFTGWGGISVETVDWWGHALHIDSSGWLSYSVPVENEGVYELFVTAGTYENYPATVVTEVDGTPVATAVIDTCDWEPNVKVSLGYIPLQAGDNDIKINFTITSGGPFAMQYFSLKPVPSPSITKIKAGGESFSNGDSIKRGTDSISIVCTNPFNIESAKDAEILIADSESDEIPVKIIADENELVLSFLKTLSYEKEYTLNITGLKDAYGYTLDDIQISFSTFGEDGDSGIDTAVITSAPDLQNTTVIKVEGQVKNSLGDGIQGRSASLEIKAPDNADVITLETVSLADGKVDFSYELPESAEAGKYKVILKSEYSEASDEAEVRYISEELKLQILEEIKDSGSASEVETILGLYSQELGIDLSELNEKTEEESGIVIQYGLSDKSFFYGRFAGKNFEKLEDFNSEYKINLALELFIQNGSADAREAILTDENYSQILGIDTARFDYLNDENKALFKNDISLVDRNSVDTTEKLISVYNDLTNKYFLVQNTKGNVVLDAKDVSVYTGQQAEIKLDCGNVADLCGYILEVGFTGDAAEKINLEADSAENAVKTSGESSVKFLIENLKKNEYQSLGTVTFETADDGEYEFTVGGKVYYQIEGFPYELYADIESTAVKVNVSKNTSSSGPSSSSTPGISGGGGSSGGGGGGGGSSGGGTSADNSSKPADEEKTEEIENTKKEFTDLESVPWAQESIDYLYEKGIIAESADGKFRPDDAVTRAEFIKMLVMTLGIYDEMSICTFSDVSKDSWYSIYVASAQKNGMILGNEKNLFNPDAEITRQDICVILNRVMDKLGYENKAYEPHFADDEAISEYAKNAVYRLYEFKVINGVGNNIFDPLNSATRAMSAKMLVQFLKGVEAA